MKTIIALFLFLFLSFCMLIIIWAMSIIDANTTHKSPKEPKKKFSSREQKNDYF